MNSKILFSITRELHTELRQHLLRDDGKEAVAFVLCGEAASADRRKFIAHRIIEIPNADYKNRSRTSVTWNTEILPQLFEEAGRKRLSIFKVHSHPNGFSDFSALDDKSDKQMCENILNWMDDQSVSYGSIIMFSDGSMKGRVFSRLGMVSPIETLQVVADMIVFHRTEKLYAHSDSDFKNMQTLGSRTVNLLRDLKVAVVGYSGTGSPVVEQIARLGVGEIVIVDHDCLEKKNLNRILNSTLADAVNHVPKVDIAKRFINALDPDIDVKIFETNLYESESAIRELSTSDIIFGCVDTVDGRHLLNLISTFYCVPYFDLGVKLIADGKGGIEKICGSIHYIQPGCSSLLSRKVYTANDLEAASLLRANKEEYMALAEEKYIKNVTVESPAVISVNMNVASTAINEFLSRLHPIKTIDMANCAIVRICISDGYIQFENEEGVDMYLRKFVGLGDRKPLLNLPELSFDIVTPSHALQAG